VTRARKKTKARGKSTAARRGSRKKTASKARKKTAGKAAPRKATAKRSAAGKTAPRKAAAKRSAGAKASPRKAAANRSARAKPSAKAPVPPPAHARSAGGRAVAIAPRTSAKQPNRAVPRRAARARPKTPSAPLPKPPTPAGVEPRSTLGAKYTCFECGAKFYDLNRPQPLCPKCGADQRNQPAREVKLKGSPAGGRRPARRAMTPLLVEDEDEAVIEDEVVMDLELAVIDSPDALADDEDNEDEGTE
jgi:hypothetical protein